MSSAHWTTEFGYRRGDSFETIRDRATVKLRRLASMGDGLQAKRVLRNLADAKRYYDEQAQRTGFRRMMPSPSPALPKGRGWFRR
jgi:hypothetical protein